ncbi:hypothetical protein [Falsiroseomonas selenitidurans]|uniref:Uncharacterized protein n=1 Tax=Falsiroseomonas selenitidurans TaxID=2716335 RepID=A0ABX1E693_9PROT|nr:hypothetical protein [Falsiroseomonas selenitidurans]NKC32714.1 hypothetical protein [Falsiroseomonas selenitidurans]
MGPGVLVAAGAAALLYLAVIHRAAARHRARRRRGEAQHLAARILAPRQDTSLAQEAGLLLRRLRGLVDDQPRALPLLAAILAGGLLLVPALDPILDDPMLLPAPLPLPGWLKAIWAGGVLLLVVGHAAWVFLNAPRCLSRQWLLLHPDGAITARGAALPRFDPARPVRVFDGIAMPARDSQPEGWAAGAVLAQDERVAAFVTNPHPPGAGDLRRLARTPPGWWRVELAPDPAGFDRFLRRHYPAGQRAVAPGWPP